MGIYLSAGDQELLEEKTKALGIFIREMQQQEVLMIGPADAALTRLNDRYRKVMTFKASVSVKGQGHITVRTPNRFSAGPAGYKSRQSAAIQKQHHLLPFFHSVIHG